MDRYTKCVLTIIAGALVWLCVADGKDASSAHAQDQKAAAPQEVVIVGLKLGAREIFPVAIPEGYTVKVAADEQIPVRLQAIQRPDERTPWHPIDVRQQP